MMSEDKNESIDSNEVAVDNKQEISDENQVATTTEQEKESSKDFLDNFDWDKHEQGIEEVSEDQIKKFDTSLEDSLWFINELDVIAGTITNITDHDAIIDVNSKSEGVISLNEFRYNPNLKVGDKVDVLVCRLENASGQLVLSHKKAKAIKAWQRVVNAQETEEIVQGLVKSRTRGGMIVDVFGIEAFLPGSQIDVKQVRDYDQYVNRIMEFKVVKINHENKNIVVSHKALIEADLESQKREMMQGLEKGQILEGIVKNITPYGAFVDLGGVDGLVHITDLSWTRVNHPSDVLELEQKVKVAVLKYDEDKTRIQLGIKQLEEHPWDKLNKDLAVGDTVKAKVVVITDYGAFVEVSEGVEGLLHVSEMSWSTHLRSAEDFVSVGDVIEAQILTLDRENRKISFSMKQLKKDPWTDITARYPIGSEHEGEIRNFTNFGIFIQLEEGVEGLVFVSDLSWTRKVKNLSEFIGSKEKLKVKVMQIDTKERKLNLSHKHTYQNPWERYEDIYKVGSRHEGEVTAKKDRGAIVALGDDQVEAFVPSRHMIKSDNRKLRKGEKATFAVLEFNKDIHRILVSHTAVFNEEEQKILKEERKRAENKRVEKTTLGDVEGFENLKNLRDDIGD